LGLVIAAINGRAISRLVLLRGPEALRWIEWEADGRFRIGAGSVDSSDANLRPGAFRLGFAFLMLWFSTPRGPRGVLIDGGLQEPAAFRRLSRFLNHRSEQRSGPPGGGS
jgi:hypothetical protein